MTDVGVIPEDWDVKSIEPHIGKVKSGKRLPLGYFVLPNKNNHPYIRVVDMNMGYVDMSNIMYVPEEAYSAISQYIITKDDIYISVAGTLGLIGKIPLSLDGANLTENANRITDIKCNRDYLMYWLMTEYIQGCIRDSQTLGAQPKLAVYQIRDFLVAIPKSIVEQQAIADALTKVDNLITSLTKVIEKKKLIKKGAMQKLLSGEMRLDGFEGEWEHRKISEISIFERGFGLSKEKLDTNGLYECILYGDIFTKYNYTVKEGFSKTNFNEGVLSVYGDILLPGSTTTEGIDLVKAVSVLKDNVHIGGDVNIIRVNMDYVDPIFLAYYLSEVNRNRIEELTKGITIIHLHISDIKDVIINIPPTKAEQTAIANILTTMDNEIEALEKERDKYKCIKQGMMQQLLTGKIRLACQ